jgi:HAD superfamily hydrolase (TIGR01549 family)
MIKTILFDFDGTIADTIQSSIEILNFLSLKYGFGNIDEEELRTRNLQDIIKERHISLLSLPRIVKEYMSLSQKKILLQNPIKNITQLLHELNNSGYELNIITSNSVESVTIFLKKHDLFFFHHIYSDKSIFGKHVIISRFLKKFQIKKKEVFYVGDEIRDIDAAHKAGIKVISVPWGLNSKEALKQYKPDYVVNQPEEIVSVLKIIKSL